MYYKSVDKTFELVCVGNAKIDVFLLINEVNGSVRLNENNELCFKHGEKIPVKSCGFLLGGSACNASVGFSRLGLKTALVAEIGNDEFSQKIAGDLSKENINLDFLKKDQNSQSSFTIALDFKDERTLLNQHVLRKHDFNFNFETKWIYLAGLGEEWKDAYKKVLQKVKDENLKLAFNPGTPQFVGGVKSFIDILERTDILFVNKEEAACLAGTNSKPEENKSFIKTLLIKIKQMGSKTIVITDGENGSYVIDENDKSYSLGIFPSNVVQKTGAGDAYASGFISATISGLSIKESMRWGSANAAGVIEKAGAQAGLLIKEEMERKLEENKNIKAEEI